MRSAAQPTARGRWRLVLWGLVALALLALVERRAAQASPHDTFIDVETEQDLYDAISARLISSETFERLLELLARGVVLDTATREELHELPNLTYAEVDAMLALRAQVGTLGNGSVLVQVGVLSQRQLDAIAPFLGRGGSLGKGAAALGPGVPFAAWAQVGSRVSRQDREAPPVALQLRAQTSSGLSLGLGLALTRHRLGAVVFDPTRQALLATPPEPTLTVAKATLRWDARWFSALAGSYRVGFGQRVTFDDTGADQPGGAVQDDQVAVDGGLVRACKEGDAEAPSSCAAERARLVTSDVRWREGLWGVALAARQLPVGRSGAGLLDLHVWASLAPRSVASHELVNLRRCEALLDCEAPSVLRRPTGPLLSPTSRYLAARLPAMFSERMLGGNVTYARDRRSHLGVTGYVSRLHSLVSGAELALQEGARWPTTGRFGAVGLSLARGRGAVDVGAEVARTFEQATNQRAGSGGLGAVLRLAWADARRELEVVGRYYEPTFNNPYARSVAAADELQGQRARDEAGVRVRGAWTATRLSARAGLDAWASPTTLVPKLSSYLRGEWQTSARWRLGLSVSYDDKDLLHGGRDECFEGTSGVDARGEALACRGARRGGAARAVLLFPTGALVAQASHDVVDAGAARRSERRHDSSAWLIASAHTQGGASLRAQARYRDASLQGQPHDRAVAAAVEARWPVRVADWVRVRLDGAAALAGPAARAPATASLWVGYELVY